VCFWKTFRYWFSLFCVNVLLSILIFDFGKYVFAFIQQQSRVSYHGVFFNLHVWETEPLLKQLDTCEVVM
jgi:uncharacterized membrane protein